MGLFALVIFLSAIFRLPSLSTYPPGFTPDEAAFGYNAYSLLHSGKDEWGTPFWQLPFTNLRSFGDYKLPLYAFLAVPSVKFFGLSEFSTRLPNATLGILAVAIVMLLTRQLFPHHYFRLKKLKITNWHLAGLVMAISPWHLQLSRGAFEANLVTLFLPLSLLLLLTRKWWFATFALFLAFYSYHSARLLIPVIFLLGLIYAKSRPKVVIFIALGILLAPGVYAFLGSGSARTSDISLLSPDDHWLSVAARRYTALNSGLPDTTARIFSNKFFSLTSQFTKNVISYFSPEFLFTSGAKETTYGMLPNRGVLYYLDGLALILFIIFILYKRPKSSFLILLLLLICSFPPSFSKGPGAAANRAVGMLPFWEICIGTGFIYLLQKINSHRRFVFSSVLIIYLANSVFFAEDYLYHAPSILASGMNYGFKELISRVIPLSQRYAQVRVDRGLSEPHIYFAFYGQIPPSQYQAASQSWLDFEKKGLKFLDQFDGYTLGKYRFGNLDYSAQAKQSTLFVGRSSEFPENSPTHFSLYYPNGQQSITVADKFPQI